ncbi:hypothetical protein TWF730_010103 [Orbilia blumenaviensis]|uniref:Peptidase A1 domain-containing protein n=1 Tax=Orbilia blumenaviensis TaxID=1796055 RepID=A0AAV9UTZ4_9PEZI
MPDGVARRIYGFLQSSPHNLTEFEPRNATEPPSAIKIHGNESIYIQNYGGDLTLGQMKLRDFTFGATNNTSFQIPPSLGLGRTLGHLESYSPFLESLKARSLIDAAAMGISLRPLKGTSYGEPDGSIVFGGIDIAKFEPGSLKIHQNMKEGGNYGLQVKSIKFGYGGGNSTVRDEDDLVMGSGVAHLDFSDPLRLNDLSSNSDSAFHFRFDDGLSISIPLRDLITLNGSEPGLLDVAAVEPDETNATSSLRCVLGAPFFRYDQFSNPRSSYFVE